MNMPTYCATPHYLEFSRVGFKEYSRRSKKNIEKKTNNLCTIKMRGGYDEYNCTDVAAVSTRRVNFHGRNYLCRNGDMHSMIVKKGVTRMRGYVHKGFVVNFHLGILTAVFKNGTWKDEEKLIWAFPHVPYSKQKDWSFAGEKPDGPWVNITALGKIVGLHWSPDLSYIGVNLITHEESEKATREHEAFMAKKKIDDKKEAIRKEKQNIKDWETNCGKLVKERRLLE